MYAGGDLDGQAITPVKRRIHRIMKRIHLVHCLFVLVCIFGMVCQAGAGLDAPHNASKSIGCFSCHDMTSTESKLIPPMGHVAQDIDDTLFNNLCWSCHNDIIAPYVKTHSSLQGGDEYGNWAVECWVCHNQHTQEQNNVYGSSYGQLIRGNITLDNITGTVPAKSGNKSVIFLGSTGPKSFADGDSVYNGICEVCHTKTKYFRNNGTGIDQNHGGRNGTNCITCHNHTAGFIHGGGSGGGECITCHGHDVGYEYSTGEFSEGSGSTQSHSTHTENDTDDLKGPNISCIICHDINNYPYFLSGTDGDGDGKFSLAETDVCDSCHSPDGPFDGVGDVAFGAKSNWTNGVYSGNALAAGKEQWCVSCHDSGTSLISRQAPDVAGDNINNGYYQSGHGAFFTECDGCHGLSMSHNFDGKKTYDDVASNYKQGFRLININGADPLKTPRPEDDCNYTTTDYLLCFSCHSEANLLQDSRSKGVSDCTTNPFDNTAPILTGFRNEKDAGYGNNPTNIHWDHLVDINKVVGTNLWDSDGDGTSDSEASCMTCHNPHGDSLISNNSTPTVRMTKSKLDIRTGTDANGDYGLWGPDANMSCAWCHMAGPLKYYRDEPPPPNPTRPNTPINDTPADGATDLLQPLIVTASVFSDTDGIDTHQASQWLFSSANGEDFGYNQLYDSGVAAATTTLVPPISWTPGTTYYWKVRYQDNHAIWSEYSADTSFTLSSDAMPNQPVNLTPAQGAMNVDRRLTLEAAPFSDDDDISDTPQNSIWQVSTSDGTGFWSGMVYNSTSIPGSTSHVVPVQLDANSRYYWRTRSQDSAGNWSIHSEITSFTTSSLITKFEFEEGTGSVASDSEEDNDGSIINGAIWTTGFSGQGLYFDGTNDEMSWNYANEVPLNTFTMEAMVKATTTHQIDTEAISGTAGMSGQKYVFVTTAIGGSQAGAGVSVGTNGISVYEHSGGFLPPVAVYNPAAKNPVQPQLGTGWNHVVVTYTETQPRIYLNGRLVHTGLNSSMIDVFAPIQMGHGWYGGFTGTIDEVAIYNKALTQTEILQRCMELGQCTSADVDSDGVTDSVDNCPFEYNPNQADLYGNGIGNVCDYLGFWKLNEGSGFSTADESGRNHVRIATFDQWTTGVAGGSAFAGNNYNNVAIENMLDNHNGDFSLSVWLKFPTGTTNPKWSLGKGDAYNGIGFGIAHWVDTDTPIPPGLFLNDGTEEAAHRISLYASSIPRDTWGHFVWTIDRTNNIMKVYKNGQYENQLDISILGTNAVTESGVLDFATPTHMFTGALDNVAVYDFVLEPGDVQARCEADAGVGNCP